MLNLSIFLELLVFKMNCKTDTKWTCLCAQTGFGNVLHSSYLHGKIVRLAFGDNLVHLFILPYPLH